MDAQTRSEFVTEASAAAADAAAGPERARRYGDHFERQMSTTTTGRLMRRALDRLAERPFAGIGLRFFIRAETRFLVELRKRLERIADAPADPLGTTSPVNGAVEPSEIMQALLRASRGTDQAAIEHDFYVRVLRQLNPSQARILVLMSDGSSWPMVHVDAGGLIGNGHERVLSFASSVGKEAGVLLREQVPHFLAHMFSLGLIAVEPEDKSQEPQYEILEAESVVREAVVHIEQVRSEYAHIERCSIRLSEFGLALCKAALPEGPSKPAT